MGKFILLDFDRKFKRPAFFQYRAIDPAGEVREHQLSLVAGRDDAILSVLKDERLTADSKVILALAVLGELGNDLPLVMTRDLHQRQLSEDELERLGVSASM